MFGWAMKVRKYRNHSSIGAVPCEEVAVALCGKSASAKQHHEAFGYLPRVFRAQTLYHYRHTVRQGLVYRTTWEFFAMLSSWAGMVNFSVM